MADTLKFSVGFIAGVVSLSCLALISGDNAKQACMDATGAADCTLEWRAAQ